MPSELLDIPLSAIRENQIALRGVNRQEEDFQQLVDSIRSNGVINAISVRRKLEGKGGKPDGKEYELIDGLHRFTASMEAGKTDIPAQVLDMNDEQALVSQIIGNVHKVETKPIEYTRGLLRILSANPLMTQSELAAMLSVSPQFIDQRLSLTKLHQKVAEQVNNGVINLSNAFPLTKLPPDEQLNWVERAMTMGAGEFAPQVHARAKEIRDAARQGRAAGEEAFKPIPVMRKMVEIKTEYENPQYGPAIVRAEGVNDPATAFALGVAWVLQMDKASQEGQIARDKARKEQAAKDKLARDAERTNKRAIEATAKQQELKEAAAKARSAAEAAGIEIKEPEPENKELAAAGM
jgi:ParB/RepB/Spo0J family partition protein